MLRLKKSLLKFSSSKTSANTITNSLFTKNIIKSFSTTNLIFPDEIISDLKKYFTSGNSSIEEYTKIENEIINNIHFFDSEQFTDVISILGQNNRGSLDVWDLLIRKIYDYDFTLVQSKDIFNSLVSCDRYVDEAFWKVNKEINTKRESTSQRETLDLITSH